MAEKAKGTAQQGVYLGELQQICVPLPSLAEQLRIVEELEALLSDLDAAVRTLEQALEKLKRYRQAVLKTAVEGELSREWREANWGEIEPAADLLERILAERRRRWEHFELERMKILNIRPKDEKWKSRFVMPNAPETEGLPTLPRGWKWATLSQLGEMGRGKSKFRPRDDPRLYGGKYPFVQTGDVRAASGTLINFSNTYNDLGLSQSRLWPVGTVCITIAANIADTAILGMEACFPDSVVGVVADSDAVNNRYLELFLRTAKSHLDAFAPATAQKNINLEVLNALAIPLPPRQEQEVIVEVVERIDTTTRRMEETLRANLVRAARLRQAILEKAFRGELVPQDPSDEPASALLESIRVERDETIKSKPARLSKKRSQQAPAK
jgi:type I restriction enzyme S subunit